MPEVADVLRRYGPAYVERFGEGLLPSPRRAMDDLVHCRTETLGGHLWPCEHCGQEHYVYHACRHRRCPTCHRPDTEAWLAERRQELLPVTYFHLVFTVPHELGEIIRQHQKDLYDILIRAAAQALLKLSADPHYVGGLIGVLCVLHTWPRTLAHHPHVHCLVPAGGVSADRTEWRPARTSYLVPVHRPLLRQLQLALAGHAAVPPPTAPARESHPPDFWCPPLRAGQPCPHCGQGLLVVIRSLPRHPKGPP
jgi:Transposase zinc-binding domain/Putative transposase